MSESQIKLWIEDLLKQPIENEDFFEEIKNGILLCKLISKIKGKFISFNKFPRDQDKEKVNLTLTYL